MMDQPSAIELIMAVREFIEKHAIPQLQGHTAFHARVAANALAIVERELDQGAQANADEHARLTHLLGQAGTLAELNKELCRRIRSNAISWDDPTLVRHLRQATLAKVAIDQPKYSGLLNSTHTG
ncbi:MAG: DUF6285 domain-containing protein [Alphaproteobacteria bacterium]|nr:DUF6285 domain-containing protein [Alphaproteobacteria bacterium]